MSAMNEKTRKLAEQSGAVPWSQPPMRAVTGVAFTYDALEKFVESIKQDHTRKVVHLCANTIDTNLREQERKSKNKKELVEFFVISVTLVAWGCWWYSMGH